LNICHAVSLVKKKEMAYNGGKGRQTCIRGFGIRETEDEQYGK